VTRLLWKTARESACLSFRWLNLEFSSVREFTSYLKHVFKTRIVRWARLALLFLFGGNANREGWEKRTLFVHLGGFGDLAVMTSVLKHYKKYWPDRSIYLLASKSSGADARLFGGAIDRVIHIDYPAFTKDPRYGARFVRMLRIIGFKAVVNHDPSIGEIIGKMIALEVGAEAVVGYEGMGHQIEKPLDLHMKKNIEFVARTLFPRYTKVVSRIDRGMDLSKRLPNVIRHYRAIFEALTGGTEKDFSTTLSVATEWESKAFEVLRKNRIEPGIYCLFNIGASTLNRVWEPEKFAEVASYLADANVPIVVVGSKTDRALVERMRAHYLGPLCDLTGAVAMADSVALVKRARFVLSNDTAPVHAAVALQKPSITILGLGHFGYISLYGYSDINHWVYAERPECLCDNWRCNNDVAGDAPAPCIAAIPAATVIDAIGGLLRYLESNARCPLQTFKTEF